MTLRALLWVAVSTKTQAEDERNSLPTQEADGRVACAENGWNVIDVLRVPGHSRRYIDIHECARDMRAQGIDAFDKLIRYWDTWAFDVLVVRDGDRFARTQSLHAYIVEKTISIGATIFSLADGMIDEGNFRMWIAMGGYKAAGEIDSLVKKRQIGFDARARRGLPVNSKVVDSHRIERDPHTGKAIRVVVNESKRREWEDLAEVILEGIAWKQIEVEMFERFGHGSPLNQPHQPHHYYRIVYTPSFWGHNARHFKHSGKGPWIREAGHPIPDGVLMVYDVFEAVYTGEMADKIKAELTRREALKGNARPRGYRFSGLFMCGHCGYNLAYFQSPGYIALRCNSKYEQSPTRPDCDARKYLPEKKAVAYVDALLRHMVDSGDMSGFTPDGTTGAEKVQSNLAEVEKDIASLEKQIQRMILKQASVETVLYDHYDQAIHDAGERLARLQARRNQLQHDYTGLNNVHRTRAYQEIIQHSVDKFWEQEAHIINQLLRRLLGNSRFVALDGEIVGVAPAPIRRKRF